MKRSGFTLVEVLVVIAITALLAGLILTYSTKSRDQVALYVEQAKLAQTIAQAKSLTISTYNQPIVPCGYGVSIDYNDSAMGTYRLFAYNAPQCDNISFLDPGFEKVINTEQLPGNLVFADPDAESITGILFLPPNPNTWVWLHGGSATSTEGRVRIMSRSGELSVDVSVSSAGQITF